LLTILISSLIESSDDELFCSNNKIYALIFVISFLILSNSNDKILIFWSFSLKILRTSLSWPWLIYQLNLN